MRQPADDAIELARQMEMATLGETFDKVREDWKPSIEEKTTEEVVFMDGKGKVTPCIEFKDENFGILSTQIAWTNVKCPICDTYNSNSFCFDPEKDRTAYLTNCLNCEGEVIVNIPIEINNALIKIFKKKTRELFGQQGDQKSLSNFF